MVPRRILVAGGTSITGHAIVQRLLEDGARVAFTGSNSEESDAAAGKFGGEFICGSDSDSNSVEALVAEADNVLGGLDGLVLNTDVLHRDPVARTRDEQWDSTLEVNLIVPFLYTRACIPLLKKAGGSIVAVTSATAVWTEMDLGTYSVSARTLLWMTQMLAVESAPYDIRVNAVCRGDLAPREATDSDSPDENTQAPLIPPLGRLTTPADIANAVSFFLGNSAASCTGTSLVVDGGMRASLRASRVRN